MAQEFLFTVRKKGPTAFERFIAALMNCPQQKYIAECLDPAMVRRIEATKEAEAADTGNTVAQRYLHQIAKSDDEISSEAEGCI